MFPVRSLRSFISGKRKVDFWQSIINRIRWYYYRKIERCTEYALRREIRNGVYKIFLQRRAGQLYVVKIPKNDNTYSKELVQRIRSEEGFSKYSKTIAGMCKEKYLGQHVVEVEEIRRNGAYVTPFIEGYNLAEVLAGKVGMPASSKRNMQASATALICNLESYLKEFGYLNGDWDLHNLIYNDRLVRIINVDLEGFFMYQNGEIEASLDHIRKNLARIGE